MGFYIMNVMYNLDELVDHDNVYWYYLCLE